METKKSNTYAALFLAHFMSKQCILRVSMLSFTYKGAAGHPPWTGLQFPLFHQPQPKPRGRICSLFSTARAQRPLAYIRSSTHAKGSWSGLRAQRSSAEQSKAGWWVKPWTRISVAPCCLLNNQPVLPNAHCCLAAFCKPAICKRLQGPCTSLQSCLLSLCLFKISYEAR